jgi:CheY-like chemotaxis protein
MVLQPPAKLMVDADRARLAQVFANLLSNAARYTDPGGQIEVRVTGDAGTALVSFRDSGIGIAPHRLESIFEMFSQEEPALARSRGGLGIGLALTRRLVQLHGGGIGASSDGPGKGSVFRISLPLVATCAEEPAAAPAPAPARADGGLRILVADDNRDAAETMGLLLEMMGHEVRRVHDGAAAVEAAAEFQPQLVLMDIGMPGLNGYEACRRVRAQSGGKLPTLVAVTGWGQQHDVQTAREAGFDHHLVKPVDMETLMRVVEDCVAASGRARI